VSGLNKSMSIEYKTVLAVYQDISQRIRYWGYEAKKADNSARCELCETVARELIRAAADLEKTREVNPPKSKKSKGCEALQI